MRMRKRAQENNEFRSVGIHPELHNKLSHDAIDERRTIREQLHVILCEALGRTDLLSLQSATGASPR